MHQIPRAHLLLEHLKKQKKRLMVRFTYRDNTGWAHAVLCERIIEAETWEDAKAKAKEMYGHLDGFRLLNW